MTKKEKDHKIDTIHSYSYKHYELVKEAKKELKGFPKEKFKMKVFYKSGILFCELRADKAGKLKRSKIALENTYPDIKFEFGEIKPIKVK